MAKHFTPAEWTKINAYMAHHAHSYGLPARRKDSVVLGSYNIRKLGAVKNRSAGAWAFLAKICERFDLLAIQETQDDLSGLRHLEESLGSKYGLAVPSARRSRRLRISLRQGSQVAMSGEIKTKLSPSLVRRIWNPEHPSGEVGRLSSFSIRAKGGFSFSRASRKGLKSAAWSDSRWTSTPEPIFLTQPL